MTHWAAAMLLASSLAQAGPVAELVDGDLRVELHADAGPCQHGALWAVLYAGLYRVSGCWRLTGTEVFIAWLDGSAATAPAAAFREPNPRL